MCVVCFSKGAFKKEKNACKDRGYGFGLPVLFSKLQRQENRPKISKNPAFSRKKEKGKGVPDHAVTGIKTYRIQLLIPQGAQYLISIALPSRKAMAGQYRHLQSSCLLVIFILIAIE